MAPDDLIARLDALAVHASPAPWSCEPVDYDCGSPCTPDGCRGHASKSEAALTGPVLDFPNGYTVDDNSQPRVFQLPDAEFIAALRNAWPAIRAEVARLRGERDRLQRALRLAQDNLDPTCAGFVFDMVRAALRTDAQEETK